MGKFSTSDADDCILVGGFIISYRELKACWTRGPEHYTNNLDA